jgi:hypothetical protein
MTKRSLAALALLLTAALATWAAEARQDANGQTESRLKKDVTFLASPACEGRGPATQGLKKAGDYLAAEFKKIGLEPAFKGEYFQPFAIAAARADVALVGPRGQRIALKHGVHFNPLGLRQQGRVKGGVVFAGYGHQDTKAGYDDFADLDLEGKVVVLLTGQPRVNTAGTASFLQQIRLIAKLTTAEKKGAAAVIIANGASLAGETDRLVDYSYGDLMRGGKHLPAILARRDVVETMLPANTKLDDLEREIGRDLKPRSFELAGWKAEIDVVRDPEAIPLRNVVGVLKGSGPLADETIVVGAHYDHLGFGGPSSTHSPTHYAIHHGADDNASGTAALLELARRFKAMKDRQGRRIVFCAFAGEEQGLYGSQAYCEKPPFPMSKTAAMFNLDMVGRLRVDGKSNKAKLFTEGHGTAKPFKELIENLAKKHEFTLSSKPGGRGPSDHASFYAKKVPVLFFWTNDHDDYHKPSDTADRIDYAGMRRVVDASEEVVVSLTKIEKPEYVEVKGDTGPRPSTGPRLGIKPGYSDDVAGVVVEGVTPGTPADKGGLKKDDVIVGLAGKPVKDLRTYMTIMAVQKPKTTIDVEVTRDGKKVTLKVPLE